MHTLIETILKWQKSPDWWPGNGVFEIAVSAVLTQNTNWKNVEKAMSNLNQAKIEGWKELVECDNLENIIKPAGFYKSKASTLRSLGTLFITNPEPTREDLLRVKGIGPETADSILLYALGKPAMVVDAYTMRILENCGIVKEKLSYEQARTMLLSALGELSDDVNVLKRLHAGFVEIGKRFCKKQLQCKDCPLKLLKEKGSVTN